MDWTLARRTGRMRASAIREILHLTERPGILSMAGGLPSADGFPIEVLAQASARVLRDTPREALQYAPSEGYGPLRDWVAQRHGVAPDHVMITTGSQQGLDLVGKVLLDAGSAVAVETPTYLGALQAFQVYEPRFVELPCDAQGPLPDALARLPGARRPDGVRFAYLLPSFQNPTGRLIGAQRRAEILAAALEAGVPIVEDNPYGDLWFDEAPAPALHAQAPEAVVYLGSFSKVLAPGLRLGYLIAPRALFPKLLQAKQATDLHTPGFNQRIVHEVVRDGFLDRHLPGIRARHAAQRDAMATALLTHMPPGTRWQTPRGGMFFWLRLPDDLDAMALLPHAVDQGMAFVPGAPFHAGVADACTLRLSFVTLDAVQIARGLEMLGRAIGTARAAMHVS